MLRSVLTWRNKEIWIEGMLLRVAHLDGEKYTYPDDIEQLVTYLQGETNRIDLFTFVQHPPHTEPKYSFPMEWDNLAVLQVESFDHWWNAQITPSVRKRARQASNKGTVIKQVDFSETLLHGIVTIHNESPIRQGKTFPHYGMTLEGARKYAGTFLERSLFIGAFYEEQLIGFTKLTLNENRTHASIVNILAMLKHRDKSPNNAMIAFAVKLCAERGISFLVYGNFAYGKKLMDSLSQFKEANGFRRMDLPRYYIPFTTLGKVALGLGLHRPLVKYVPQRLLSRYRSIRTWFLSAAGRGRLAGLGRKD